MRDKHVTGEEVINSNQPRDTQLPGAKSWPTAEAIALSLVWALEAVRRRSLRDFVRSWLLSFLSTLSALTTHHQSYFTTSFATKTISWTSRTLPQ